MLQKRAEGKYHCGGLWTNTACGHPRDGEDISDAAHRRLFEEMGINTDLQKITSFIYHIPFDNGLEEHEYLHVFTGICDEAPVLNPQEADDWKWMSLPDLKTELEEHPEQYTYWMRITIPKIEAFLLAQRSDRE